MIVIFGVLIYRPTTTAGGTDIFLKSQSRVPRSVGMHWVLLNTKYIIVLRYRITVYCSIWNGLYVFCARQTYVRSLTQTYKLSGAVYT